MSEKGRDPKQAPVISAVVLSETKLNDTACGPFAGSDSGVPEIVDS